MGAKLLVQPLLEMGQLTVGGASAVGSLPGAGIPRFHTGDHPEIFPYGLHQVI